MGRWTIRASRWGALALLFLILAVLPATGPGPAARLAAHSAKPAPPPTSADLLVTGASGL